MTRAQRRILALLADGEWHTEDTLRTSWAFLVRMYQDDLLDAGMNTSGGTPQDRVWRIKQ